MKRSFQFFVTCILLVAISPALTQEEDKDKAKEDAKKSEPDPVGVWRLESIGMEGRLPAKDQGKTLLILFKDGEFIMRFAKEVLYGTYELDPAAKTAKMDQKVVNSTVAALKGQTMLCIYHIDGDTLKLCRAGSGKDRPTQFDTKPGSGHALQIYKRDKP